jgi:hypothetical protein
MDGNADDSSGNGYDGTLHGGNFGVSGPDGTAAYATAGGGYIRIDGLQDHAMGSEFSVCTWFRRTYGRYLEYGGIIGSHKWWLCQGREHGGTAIGGLITTTNSTAHGWTFGYQSYKPDITATNSVWHHVCMTWDGTVSNFYLDGSLADTTADSRNTAHNMRGPIAADDPDSNKPTGVMIGHRSSRDFWTGSVDNVRLYKKAVDASIVQTLYATHA